jgi:hypothetical protein
MAESKFKNLQEEVCYKEPEEVLEEEAEDKICPTCIPNENYIEPDWTLTDEPYLNEKKCEYQVRVSINLFGDIYHDGQDFSPRDPRSRIFTNIMESPYNLNTLLKTYIRPGIRKMLRFYNKLETDEIVCASPPQNEGETCKAIFGLDYEQYVIREDQITEEPVPERFETISIDPLIFNAIPEIKNGNALELVARVQDYTFITSQKMLVVLIGIPAYRFDAVPDAPDLGSLDTSTEQIVIKPPEFMRAIGLFKSAMNSFKTFQSYFYREENGSLYFEETGNPFYIRFYPEERIKKFVDRLDSLLNKNGFDLRGFLDLGTKSRNIAYEVEVSFDKSDESNPFTIKNVRARKKNCPYIECKKGLNSFIEKTKKDQTMLGYFSNINNISRVLQNNKTPPWLDFIIENTYPQLAVNYGSSGNLEDDSCIKLNLNDLSDFILDETMDLFNSIQYKFNQNKCKTKEEMLAQNAEIQDFFSGSPDSLRQLDGLKLAWKERTEQLEQVGKKIKQGWNAAGQLVTGSKKIEFPTPQEIGDNAGKAAGDFVKALNPCDFKGNLSAVLKCISAFLTLDEVYYALIKQIISSVGEEALEIIMQTLPANKQAKIRKEVEKQFKDIPFPWDPGWQGGSLGKAVDRQTVKNINEKKDKSKNDKNKRNAEEQSASIQTQIDEINRKIDVLNDVNYYETYLSSLNQQSKALQDEIKQIENNIEFINSLIEREELKIQELEQFRSSYDWTTAPEDGATPALVEQADRDISILRTNIRENLAPKLIEQGKSLIVVQTNLKQVTERILSDDLKNEIEVLQAELEILQKKKHEADTTVEDIQDYYNFTNLSEEEQQEVIDKQKERTAIVATTPSDKIQQGTLGKALGNVQQALIQAYIDEIMKSASIGELQRAIENIPGADLLGKLVSRFKCPSDPLVYPPIESFLSTLTFDPCGGEKTRVSLPKVQETPTSFNWVEQLTDAFYVSLREVFSRVIIALMMKTTQLLNADYCKLAGNLVGNLIDGGGWEGFLRDTLCPDPKTNDQRNKLNEQILSSGGAAGRGNDAYQDLARVLSIAATKREIELAMIGEPTSGFLANISTLVSNVLPQFADVFGDPNSVAQYFQTMGNFLTPAQRAALQDKASTPLEDFPVETSICLTKEEKDLWDQERQAAFSDPALGREFVNKQDEKAKRDLSDAANLLLNGPEGLLQDAIDNAFDPNCGNVVPSFSDLPQNQQTTISNAITGIFKRLERAFIDDTIEANFFSSFFGIGGNTPGVLSVILSNNKNNTINYHVAIKNNPVLSFFFGGANMELPETVGIQLKEYIDKLPSDYQVGKDYTIHYTNEKEYIQNFTSKLIINDTFDPDGKIEFTDPENNITILTDNMLEVQEEYQPDQGAVSFTNPFAAETLDKMLQAIWDNYGLINFDSAKIFEGMNADVYDKLPKTFTKRREGQISEGFLYGNGDTPILEDSDLVYVGPNGEEPYEDFFTEEDKVLGRSKTNNPRVHFLDPAKYGGTYLKPQIYIAEAEHKGWLQFSQIIMPNPTGCDPKNSNFLMLDTLIQDINKNKQKIQNHELLPYAPECTTELPFDKIANSDTLATLEGIVRATTRVHLSDFLIRSFPIFSNIYLHMDKNFDNTMLEYISEKIYKALLNETAIFASTYEGYTYALLFLEQVVQIVQRRVADGAMETNEEIDSILRICNTAQENYVAISSSDLFKMKTHKLEPFINHLISTLSQEQFELYNQEVDEMLDVVKQGCAILSGKGEGFDLLSFFESVTFIPELISLEAARLASKVYTLDSVVSEMKKLLKYIVKEELALYTKKFNEELEPRPYIYDITKFFIGGSHILLGKQIEAGVYDNEVPIGGGVGNFPYGDIVDCARADMVHALNGTTISDERFEEIKERGGFYLEKYIVSQPKENTRPQLLSPISGIQSIAEFKNFLSQNRFVFTPDSNVSDFFGDAVLSENGEEYEGSIGIKYGVRLCYIPPQGTELNLSIDEYPRSQRSFVQNPAVFQTDSGQKTLQASKYSFPIASFEQDIIDAKMQELLDSDANLDQDLKCYIDKLVETTNFKHLFDNVLQIKKVPSIYMIYSYINFLTSLGDETERDPGDENNPISLSNLGKIFNDSKKEARKLFVSYYKNNDRDPPNEEDDNLDLVQLAQRSILDKLKFVNVGEFSWDIQRRIRRDSPFGKDGNECQNNFGKLFKTGGF